MISTADVLREGTQLHVHLVPHHSGRLPQVSAARSRGLVSYLLSWLVCQSISQFNTQSVIGRLVSLLIVMDHNPKYFHQIIETLGCALWKFARF